VRAGAVMTAVAAICGVASAAAARPRVPHTTPVAQSAPVEWPRPEVLAVALRAYECGQAAGYFRTTPLLTIIDYSLPSTTRRLWVLDVPRREIVFHELVAHGEGSGDNFASRFSNRPGSRRSSLGLFRTEDVYRGEHGVSLRLAGLEPGVNDRASERAIVIHAAPYVSPSMIAARGRLGRSWGCPAVEPGVHRRLIERIKGGTALVAYYPDDAWLGASRFLRCTEQLARD